MPQPHSSSAPSADLGLFGPDSITWRVLADPAAGIGGLRALFLQALHPLAMAGVYESTRGTRRTSGHGCGAPRST